MNRLCEEYLEIEHVLFDNGRGVAFAENPLQPQPYVTWMFTESDGKRSYEWGHYTKDRDGALADFAERVADYQEQYKVGVVTDSRRTIKFIDSRYKELFTVKDGGDVFLKLDDGELLVRPCRYIGEYHAKIGGNIYHICEFAERMEQAGTTYTPQPPGMRLELLPERCYSTLPSNGDLILVLRGDSQQHPVSYSSSDPEQNRRMADQYNGLLGVTKAQEAAMLGGALFGWDAPAADPRSYDEQGKPYKPSRRQGRSNPETDRGR